MKRTKLWMPSEEERLLTLLCKLLYSFGLFVNISMIYFFCLQVVLIFSCLF